MPSAGRPKRRVQRFQAAGEERALDGVLDVYKRQELLRAVAADEVVLASVSAEIRSLAAEPARRGGHLVLVIDCSADARRLCFHDPAGEAGRMIWLLRSALGRSLFPRNVARNSRTRSLRHH